MLIVGFSVQKLGFLQVVFVASALQSTVQQYAITPLSPVFEKYRSSVSPPGTSNKLQLSILWYQSNLIQDSDDINSDWTFWKDAFVSAVSDFIPTKKIKGKNTPPWITSEIIHALWKKEAARSKLKKSPTDHQQQKYRELRAKAKTLIRKSRETYLSSLNSDLARQPKRFWSFFKLKNRMRTFPEMMSSGDDTQQSSQASTPQQIAELFNSYFVSVFTASSEAHSLSVPSTPFTPHTK